KINGGCNLRCSYCYYIDPDTGRGPHGMGLLPLVQVEAALQAIADDALEHRLDEVFIAWHGGEPLLNGADYFVRIFAYVDEQFQGKCRVRHKVQSNLTLMTPRLASVFSQYSVHLSTSIDGPRQWHDKHRIDARGLGTFDRVTAGLKLCRDAGLSVSCLTVVQPE